MKNYIAILIATFLLVSCEPNVIGDFGDTATAPQETDADLITKKGVAYTNRAKAWSHRTSELGAHWMYSWGNELREEIPEDVEYVPMFWGKGSVTDDNISRIKGLIAEGKVKYVLGFNEPDGADQANMSVDEAIALWPKIEELGVPIGSPATVNPENAWMVEFMQKAEAANLRVDFITVHSYGGSNVLNFINKLKNTYNAYGKRPIWVTEFAVADWNATSPDANRYSQQEVISFMQQATQAMNNIDWVHRYAWFDGRQAPLYTSSLFDEDSNITAVGEVYAAINRNENIGPGQDTEYIPPVDDKELMVNGGFESGEINPWSGFKNGIVGTEAEPKTGNFAGRIENGDGSLVYVAAAEAGKTYTLKFWTKWLTEPANTISAKIRNDAGNVLLFSAPDLAKTTDWSETSYEFTVPEGVSTLRFVFYKANGFPPLFLDDVSFKLKE